MPNFLFELSTGQPVNIEPFHYAIVGQTQFSGKTTLIKRLSGWAVDLGYKILVFDTKETEADYADFGQGIPVCLRETTDSFVLIGLLESMFRRRLTPYYATLSRLTEAAKGFEDIIKRAKDLEAKTKSSWLRDACRVLYDLLERLRSETAKVETVPQLRLNNGINRMDINQFSLEAQQLIVKNSFEDALRIYKRNLILVIDEAFKFIPQGYSSAATRAIMNLMTQGAKTGLFGWISTQFLAVTDKDPLKACAVKFLGTQDHATEVKHTLDLIPEVRGKYSPDDIMKLKLGHWILVRKRPMYVGIVYALPVGVPEEVGVEVARGIRTPEYVRDHFLKPSGVLEGQDLVWKERYEELLPKYDEAQRKLGELLAQIGQPREIETKLQQTIESLKAENESLRQDLKKLQQERDEFLQEVRDFEAFKHALEKIFPMPTTTIPTGDVPSEVSVQHEIPTLTVHILRKPLTLSTDNAQGRLALIYAEGFFDEQERTLGAIQSEMIRHGWPKDPRLSSFLDEMCSWGFLKKRRTDRWLYSAAMKSSVAKDKGLLKEVEG